MHRVEWLDTFILFVHINVADSFLEIDGFQPQIDASKDRDDGGDPTDASRRSHG